MDPADVDTAIELWARWRRGANYIPTGLARGALARLYPEGAEIERRTARVRRQNQRLKQYAAVLLALISIHVRRQTEARDAGDHYTAAVEANRIAELRRRYRRIPKSIDQLPFAALISGRGRPPDPSFEMEQAIDGAVMELGGRYRAVIFRHYLDDMPQEVHARIMGVHKNTFQRWLYDARRQVRRALERRGF